MTSQFAKLRQRLNALPYIVLLGIIVAIAPFNYESSALTYTASVAGLLLILASVFFIKLTYRQLEGARSAAWLNLTEKARQIPQPDILGDWSLHNHTLNLHARLLFRADLSFTIDHLREPKNEEHEHFDGIYLLEGAELKLIFKDKKLDFSNPDTGSVIAEREGEDLLLKVNVGEDDRDVLLLTRVTQKGKPFV